MIEAEIYFGNTRDKNCQKTLFSSLTISDKIKTKQLEQEEILVKKAEAAAASDALRRRASKL
ncbi:hypothetical protein HHL22_20485 [Hymenobacter sp. RP-2-7]|uniref:Uncharacterized protein n=1 Tax=Hymenobacter polaris TaxID=2682546 RepID=A0A7Y0AHV3_9BACT|nr:hypothetical protein [Hymenobacter polaris]NML67585.1 hypothetical protein [Hymenobacter polaris]